MQLKIGNNIKYWLLLFIFVSHLLPGHIGLVGYVLCVGNDGHVAIEAAAEQATCIDLSFESSQVQFQPMTILHQASSDAHCGDCIDLPIVAECKEYAKVQTQHSSLRFFLPSPRITSVDDIIAIKSQQRFTDDNFSIFQHTSLTSLRTIVLLI